MSRAMGNRLLIGRRRADVWLALAIAVRAACAGALPPSPPAPDVRELPALPLAATDRLLVLAPHPDDETIACGGVLQQAATLGIPVRVAFLTYGDNNQWSFAVYRKHVVIEPSAVRDMGEVRHDEAVAATGRLGIPADRLAFLGYPDFRTLNIWMSHWGQRPPLESMLTRVTSVPYTNAFRYGAPYKGESVLADLEATLREFKPTQVFVSHPADFNPDHRALYLFTQVALWDLERDCRPVLRPYLVHFPRWPAPRRQDLGAFLVPPPPLAEAGTWCSYTLSPTQRVAKAEAIRLHRTQYGYSAGYLESFARANECFGGLAPVALSTNNAAGHSMAGRPAESPEPEEDPATLTEEERARFVGVEWRHLSADAQGMTLTLRLSRPLAEAVGASVAVCGYRPDVPFARMPKLHVAIGMLATQVYDNGRELPRDGGVSVTRRLHELDVRIPWTTLGAPARLMMSARTTLGEIPLDWAAWRVVDVVP